MRKIAITGGTASGKSLVCQILQDLGVAYVIDSDEIVRRLFSTETPLGRELIVLLGESVLTNGQFDRKKIAKLVFSHPEKLQALEKILHPVVIKEIRERYRQMQHSQDFALFVVELPLLYEINEENFYDAVISVLSDPSLCHHRFVEKNGRPEEYDQRMQRQLPPQTKAKLANFVIVNNGSKEELKKTVETMIPSLIKM